MTEAAITPGPTTPEPTAPEPTAPGRVVVLGAGTMGTGIALAFALAGSTVHGWSRRTVSIERAERHLDAAVGDLADLGLLREPPKAVRHRIRLGTDVRAGMGDADLVIETIREDLDDKQALMRQVSGDIPPDAVITSNTSSLALGDIFAEIPALDRVAGLHWFNPPELIGLVEVVRAPFTSDATMARLTAWMSALGKTPVIVNNAVPGFIANRLQYALIREAYQLVADGVCTPADIDRAVTSGIGARWAAIGPFQSMDLAGLDVHLAVARTLFPDLCGDTSIPEVLNELTSRGALGCKSGSGLLGTYSESRTADLVRLRASVLAGLARIKKRP